MKDAKDFKYKWSTEKLSNFLNDRKAITQAVRELLKEPTPDREQDVLAGILWMRDKIKSLLKE